jgi:hypothetical protein
LIPPFPIHVLLYVMVLANFGYSEVAKGIIEHRIPSPHQAADTTVRVLMPDRVMEGRRYRVLYVLPVRAESDERHGQGLVEVRDLNIHNRYDVICISPAFT